MHSDLISLEGFIMKSWFSNVLEAARKLISEDGEDYITEQLGVRHGVNDPSEPIERDLDYVRITLRSSRIVSIRKGTGKFYASVQSRVRYLNERTGEVDYQKIIVPEMREMDAKNVDRVLLVDQELVGPVPYIGGLDLELGLFSVKAADLAGPYLELLSTLAKQTTLSAALPFVEPLRKGADLLFGNSEQSTLEIGLERTWAGGELRTGTWLLMRAPKGTINLSDLKLDARDGKVTDSRDQPIKKYPYLVFSISRSRRRDDWMKIPDLKAAWDAIGAAAKKGENEEAEQRLQEFQRKARWSPDLVPEDSKRLVVKAKERLSDLQPTHTIALAKRQFPSFEELDLYDVVVAKSSQN
jgi:hypothetical protein